MESKRNALGKKLPNGKGALPDIDEEGRALSAHRQWCPGDPPLAHSEIVGGHRHHFCRGVPIDRVPVMPPCTLSLKELKEEVCPAGAHLSVAETFSNSCVLITGATGYVGSLLLEQLLRMVPDIRKIYLIVRGKRDLTGEERVERLLERSLFHLLKGPDGRLPPSLRAKIHVMRGDLLLPGCGLSLPDLDALTEDVDYVIHSAACISFEDHIHNLIAQNFQGTKHIADVAKNFKKLRLFCHLSTAYVNCDQPRGSHLEERVYPLHLRGKPLDPDTVLGRLASLSPPEAEKAAADLLQELQMPNCYMLTKRLTEVHMRERHGKDFRLVIVRPSIVGSTSRLPDPGYFGNSAGQTAIAMAYAIGVATFTAHIPWHVFDVIPGDLCSSIILAAIASGVKRPSGPEPMVVHACSTTTHPQTLYRWWHMSHVYWAANPAPVQFNWRYPSMEVRVPPVGLSSTGFLYRLYSLLGDIKFWLISFLLHLLGRVHYAQRLWLGWLAWKLYSKEGLDFNVFFCTSNAQKVEDAVVDAERPFMKMIWRPWDDWVAYQNVHFDRLQVFYFRRKKYERPLPTAADVAKMAMDTRRHSERNPEATE